MKLDELKRLDAAATPAPWAIEDTDDGFRYVMATHDRPWRQPICSNVTYYPTAVGVQDQALIAAARNALPKLIAVAEAAKELLATEAVQATVERIRSARAGGGEVTQADCDFEYAYALAKGSIAELEAQP
jgi:hypothetical protein